MGSNAIRVSFNGQVGVCNSTISNNSVSFVDGQGISVFIGGTVTGTTTIDNNNLNLNQTDLAGTQGLAVQVDDGPAGAGTSAADYNFNITNNTVQNYEGNGIRAIARASNGKMDVAIQNNLVGTPILSNRNAIRVDSGSSVGDTNVCMNMTGNTNLSNGALNGSGVNAGIGLRKQGSVATTNDFGIVGIAANPTNAQVQAFVGSPKPPGQNLTNAAGGVAGSSANGNGVDIISGNNFLSCTLSAKSLRPQRQPYYTARVDDLKHEGSVNTLVAFSNVNVDPSALIDHLGMLRNRPAKAGSNAAARAVMVQATSEIQQTPSAGLLNRFAASLTRLAATVDSLITPTTYAAENPTSSSAGMMITSSATTTQTTQIEEPSREAGTALRLNHARGSKLGTRNSKRETLPVEAHHAKSLHALAPALGAGGTVTVNIGTLAPGDSVTITFQVTIDNPYSGGPNVSNQGTVSGSNFSNVLTDDPAVGGAADPTLTPINVAPDVSISNAKVAEPTSGTTPMLFTVALSAPAAGTITVTYNTADGSAVAPGDYVSAVNQTVTFAAGEQLKIIPITVNSDVDGSEGDENFTVTISVPPGQGNVVGATGTGTITAANPAGTLLISELRTSGPGGSADEFVEIYNNTDTPHVVAATNGSTGYGVFKMGASCNATPILVGTIPNGTTIPARGHYLLVGSAYSLADYGGTGAAAGNLTMTSDIENDRNVSIFSTTNILALSTTTRFDAVGFGTNTGNVCDLQREGTNLGNLLGSTLQYSFFRTMTKTSNGNPKDTNDNAADFLFADTTGTLVAGAGQHLGAPGPENLASPIRRDTSGILLPLLDSSVSSASAPNRFRDLTPAPPTASQGTMEVRRRVQNTTGATVTRLRFRIVDITTFPSPGAGTADLRVLTSSAVTISGINDPATCASTGTPATVPCQVTAQVTTLETPPAQANGGGYNSTVTVTLPGPGLANNASIDVNFKLGVVTTGNFRFLIIVEALP
jgi:hypothetical protein